MQTVLISASIASLVTAVFTFRFRMWARPGVIVGFFTLFFTFGWIGEHFFLPPGVLGAETAYVCFSLTGIFVGAIMVVRRYEDRLERDRPSDISPPD